MIPLKDYNPTARLPFVTILIILACAAIYFFVQPVGQGLFTQRTMDAETKEVDWDLRHAAIPCELTEGRPLTEAEVRATFENNDSTACTSDPVGPRFATHKNVYLAVLYSMFLHGKRAAPRRQHALPLGLRQQHRGSDATARLRRLLPCWGCGRDGDPRAAQPELDGASRRRFGCDRRRSWAPTSSCSRTRKILTIVPLFLAFLARIRAKWVLIFWFIEQFFVNPNSGVAWAAHVGGFVFGAIVAFVLRDRLRPPRRPLAGLSHWPAVRLPSHHDPQR